MSELFHTFGVNNRYLGEVIAKIESDNFSNVRTQLEKCVLARCAKHVLREFMRDAPRTLFPHAVAHLLNCLFANEKQKSLLNDKKIRFELEQPDLEQGKKKANKNKKQQPKVDNSVLSHTPSEIWSRVQEIAKKRYGHELKSFPGYAMKFSRLATLRDICLRTGLVLQLKEYKFDQADTKKYSDLPF